MTYRFVGLCLVFILGTQGLFAQQNTGNQGRTAGRTPTSSFDDDFYRDFSNLKAEIADLKVLVADLKNEITNKQVELSYLREEVNKTSTQLNALQDEMKKTTQALASLNNQKSVAQSEVDRVTQSLAKLTKQRDDMQLEIANLQHSVQNARVAAAQNTGNQDGSYNLAASDEAAFDMTPGNLLQTLYFNPDSTILITSAITMLDDLGTKMLQDMSIKISIRGYAAPAGTKEGQMLISERRAKNAVNYLKKFFGITDDRMDIRWVGAQEVPKTADGSPSKMRAVEILSI